CIVFILISCFSLHDSVPLPFLHSFPTRRSSDLMFLATLPLAVQRRRILSARSLLSKGLVLGLGASSFDSIDLTFMRNWLNVIDLDRKSTRLNSSHRTISYAVFCLKKKKYKKIHI